MRKLVFNLLIIIAISFLNIHTALAITFSANSTDQTVTAGKANDNTGNIIVANPQVYFGQYSSTEEMELDGFGASVYYAYIPIENDAVEKYRNRMETLGFDYSLERDNEHWKLIKFEKNNSWILMIYSAGDSKIVLCYQKDVNFTPEEAVTDPIDAFMNSIINTQQPGPTPVPAVTDSIDEFLDSIENTQHPDSTPTPKNKTEVGYVDVEIDGTQYHFTQVSSKKDWTIMGKPTWELRFVEIVRDEVRSSFYLNTSRGIMPGDAFGPKDLLDLDFDNDGVNSFTFFDRDDTCFILDEYSRFSIVIDTLNEIDKGYEVTGRFNGTIYKDGVLKERENKRVKNGTFKFVMHNIDEVEVSYDDEVEP